MKTQKAKPRALIYGFTLIELLIVVLIIAILAAIAVPNFLEFQTRAKVSRVMSDMRSISTAIEAYAVDNGTYPAPDDVDGGSINFSTPPTFFETKIPHVITTPIAYTTTLFNDVFINLAEKTETYYPYHYACRWYSRVTTTVDGGEVEFNALDQSMFTLTQPRIAAEWYLLSHGPDSDHDAGPSSGSTPGLPGHITGDGIYPYDPTNGTASNGDLVIFGPGLGFPNS